MHYSKIFIRVVFIFVVFFYFLFLVEISLRTLGHFYSRKTVLDEISNSQTFNILCLGDSFTYGWGVETAYSYPKQLEGMLNNGNLIRRFNVINLAVPGSNSSQHLKYLEDILSKYRKLSLIIILTGVNDGWNLADSNIYKFINKKQDKLNLINIKLRIFLSNFRTYKMLKAILLNLKGKAPESEISPFKQLPGYENIDKGILKQLLEYNLTQLVDLAKFNNLKIILLNYPRGDLYGDNITKRVALHFKVPFVDNYSAFNKKLKGADFGDLFIYDNSHPNAVGYKIMAEGIYKAIVEEMLK